MTGNHRALFDIPDDVTYLNCASQSPLLRASVAAGEMGVSRKARPWGSLRDDAAHEAEQARALFANLIGAMADDIALVPATSYGASVAAANLPIASNQKILVLEEQFPSNYYAWQHLAETNGAQIATVPRPDDGDWTSAVLARIHNDTAIAALPTCHWTNGGRLDLEAIGTACRSAGTALVIDATQFVGAAPFDVHAIQPDFMVCSAYKWLLCPYTLAFLYVAPHRQSGIPIEFHAAARGGTAGATGYTLDYVDSARRFDMGERNNLINLPMAVAALTQLGDWTPHGVAEGLAPLIERVADGAEDRGYAVPPAAHRVSHYIGLRSSVPPLEDLPDRFAAENIHISLRGGGIRLSPHLFADIGDIDRFFTVFDRLRTE